MGRRNDSRMGEKIATYIPFISKISSANIGQAMRTESESFFFDNNNDEKEWKVYENSEILSIINPKKKGCCSKKE